MSKWIKSLAKVNIKAVGEIIDLVAENKELKAKLAKGQESFELVLDNAVSDKATINLLCNALQTLCMDFEDYADPREPFDYKTEIAKHRALAKQHKQTRMSK